jgi:hypothetical protein
MIYNLDLPAGSPVRLTAATRPNVGAHRWDLRVISAAQGPALAFGSQIGGLDRLQHVDIAPQASACRLEISAGHKTVEGWEDDQGAVLEDTPNRFEIGFCDADSSEAKADDLSLSLVFGGAGHLDVRRR